MLVKGAPEDLCDDLPWQTQGANFSQLCDEMRKHLKPTEPSAAVEHARLHVCVRGENQSIAVYVTSLKKIAKNVRLGDELDDKPSEILFCGANDNRMETKY